MSVIWTPDPLELPELLAEYETATDISVAISAEIDPEALLADPTLAIVSIDADISPAQQILEVVTSPAGAVVSAQSLAGLFPIEFIDYIQAGQLQRVHDWQDLPHAVQVIQFRAARTRQQDYTLTLTATLSNSSTSQVQYLMIVYQEWTAGKQALQEAVNASSSQTG